MIRLAIFDLDGTLLNTIRDLGESVNYALDQCGFPTHDIELYPGFVGNGVNKLIERTLPEGQKTESNILQVKSHFVKYYDSHNTIYSAPYPGIPALLEWLDSQSVVLAVASNKYQFATCKLIDHYFSSISFHTVLGQREDFPIKPDPAIVLHILSATGISPEETIYIGDSGVDMLTASRASTSSVGVTWGFRPKSELIESGACYIVDNPEEIIHLCKSNVF